MNFKLLVNSVKVSFVEVVSHDGKDLLRCWFDEYTRNREHGYEQRTMLVLGTYDPNTMEACNDCVLSNNDSFKLMDLRGNTLKPKVLMKLLNRLHERCFNGRIETIDLKSFLES